MAQTPPMAIGSAFDAYVKCDLYRKLNGNVPPEWEFDTLFEKQVEPGVRDWARVHGYYAFTCYRNCGALSDLLLELEQAIGSPRFELDIQAFVYGNTVSGVPLLGKPDLYFQNKDGRVVIIDWKVNGYCSKYNTSPAKGYISLKGDREKGAHKDAVLEKLHGLTVNTRHYLEQVDEKWANQVAVYGWLTGEDIGNEFIAGIDQLVCSPTGIEYPSITVARHRVRVSHNHQVQLWEKIVHAWTKIQEGHIFDDMSLEDSVGRCEALDEELRHMTENPEFYLLMNGNTI